MAAESKRTLEELWLLPPMEKHWLIAYYRTKNTMLAYDQHIAEIKRKQPKGKKSRG